jgi:hypothetical protein
MNTDENNPNLAEEAESLRIAYQAMSADKTREAEANEWCEALSFEPVDSDR